MIEFTEIKGKPDEAKLKEIVEFYASIFAKIDREKFHRRINKAENLHIVLAFQVNRIVGFKIGYQIEPKKFYSWIGGVDKNFRAQGIAAELIKRQHLWCVKNKFDTIQTKTQNKFKAMLILNIKHDFDIIDVYRDSQNELKIVLEKPLSKIKL